MRTSRDDSSIEQDKAFSIDDWEDDLLRRYPPESEARRYDQKSQGDFRDYSQETRPGVREFYRENHSRQTFEFVQAKRREFLTLDRHKMGIWDALLWLNELIDDSDPDTELSQIEHLMQSAEAIRADGHPRWFILTGLIHDLGKVLCLMGEPQWAVVGDTFPVGCAFSDRIVFHEFFQDNPDSQNPVYRTRLGIYEENVGLDNVQLSWGHDEYLYHVVKDHLPREALWMIRYHSCYPIHHDGAYDYLLSDQDRTMLAWVRRFNPYDLYSKGDARPDVEALRPFYQELIAEFFPDRISW